MPEANRTYLQMQDVDALGEQAPSVRDRLLIRVLFRTGCRISEALGLTVDDEDFRDDTVDAGEVGAGHSVTALYEVKLHEGAGGRVATVYIRYEDSDTGEVTEISRGFDSSEFSREFEEASPRFQLDAAVAEYAEILRESYWAQGSSLEEVQALAQRVSTMLPDDRDVTEFVQLVTLAVEVAPDE